KRETLARLAAVESNVKQIDGILITHEHTDHCNGLPQMLGLWKAPLYVTEPTMDAMKHILPETFQKRLRGVEMIHAGQPFAVGDIEVHAFAIPHDAGPGWFHVSDQRDESGAGDGPWLHAGTGESASARRRVPDPGIESRSRDAESRSVSVGGEAAHPEPHWASFESRGERVSFRPR